MDRDALVAIRAAFHGDRAGAVPQRVFDQVVERLRETVRIGDNASAGRDVQVDLAVSCRGRVGEASTGLLDDLGEVDVRRPQRKLPAAGVADAAAGPSPAST